MLSHVEAWGPRVGVKAVLVGLTVLHIQAASALETPKDANPHVCAELTQRLEQGARETNDRRLNFLLFEAAAKGCGSVVVRLLGAGASLDARDRFANTALLQAAAHGHEDLVGALLDRGAAINHRNLAGASALLRAIEANERRTVKLLLDRGADLDVRDSAGVTPLAAAAFNGNARIVKLLLAAGADPTEVDRTGKGPIVYAAAKGFLPIVRTLIDAGVDPNAAYGHDLTALMWAAGHGNDVPETEGLAVVEDLLARAVDVEAVDDRGRSALMIAAERGHATIAAYLLERGADRARRDKEGKSAIDLASTEAVRAVLSE